MGSPPPGEVGFIVREVKVQKDVRHFPSYPGCRWASNLLLVVGLACQNKCAVVVFAQTSHGVPLLLWLLGTLCPDEVYSLPDQRAL